MTIDMIWNWTSVPVGPAPVHILSANARGIQNSAPGYVVIDDDWRCITNGEQPDVPPGLIVAGSLDF